MTEGILEENVESSSRKLIVFCSERTREEANFAKTEEKPQVGFGERKTKLLLLLTSCLTGSLPFFQKTLERFHEARGRGKAPPLAALHPSSRLTLQHADDHLDHTVLTGKKEKESIESSETSVSTDIMCLNCM